MVERSKPVSHALPQTGQIVLHDKAEKLQKNEMIQKAYLGME